MKVDNVSFFFFLKKNNKYLYRFGWRNNYQKITEPEEENYVLREYSAEVSQAPETGGHVESKTAETCGTPTASHFCPGHQQTLASTTASCNLAYVQEASGCYAQTKTTGLIYLMKHMSPRFFEPGSHQSVSTIFRF